MRRDLKQKIKQDELRSGMEQAWAWSQAHPGRLKAATLGVIVFVAAAIGINHYLGERARQAEQEMTEAVRIFHARVAGEGEPAEGEGPSFDSADEKYRKAAAAFDGIERRFGSRSAVGRRAHYYGALCRIELGQLAEAQKELEEIAKSGDKDALEPALARLALAGLYRRQGDLQRAVDSYRQLVDDPSPSLPRDHALMTLATVLEEARRVPEAAASYERLADEFPSSVYADEARRRAEYLRSLHG